MSSDETHQNQKIKFDRRIPVAESADYIAAVADGLRAGSIMFKNSEECLTLHAAPTVLTEVKAKRKGTTASVYIELSWELTGHEAPRVYPRPKLDDGDRRSLDREAEPQPPGIDEPDAAEKRAWLSELSREALYEKAQALELSGRSQMSKDDLVRELADRYPATELFTREQLYLRAQAVGLAGRSTMSKQELLDAL